MTIPKNAPLADQFAVLSMKWDNSIEKEVLITIIQEKVLTSESLRINNVMCLGLGTMEDIEFLPFPSERISLFDLPDSQVRSINVKSKRLLKIALLNHSLAQLLAFETVLEIFGEKFDLPQACFQDPAFSQMDVDFLAARGHKVIRYSNPDEGDGRPCDPRMLRRVTKSTFLFAPALDNDPLAEVIGIGKPGLILSCDPLRLIGPSCLWVPDYLLPAVEDYGVLCNFIDIPIDAHLGCFGFTWPLQTDNEKSILRLQARKSLAGILKVERAKEKGNREAFNRRFRYIYADEDTDEDTEEGI